jgi:hypothetical protein
MNMSSSDPLTAALKDADSREIGGVRVEVVRAGAARVKRMIYPKDFQWSKHMKPIVGTDLCTHAHVGFLVKGHIQIRYADGCEVDFVAPQVLAIDPGHDGKVIGGEPAIVVEFDFERDTVSRLGMPETHKH